MKAAIIALLTVCTLLTIPLSGCRENTSQPLRDLNIFQVSVRYREQIMLPPGCKLILTLKNISLLNSSANTLASRVVSVQAAPPFNTLLEYDASLIDKRLNYSLDARIELHGQLLFTSTERVDPFAVPAGELIDIQVKRVKHSL